MPIPVTKNNSGEILMSPENTKKLYDKYPELFKGKDMPITQNLMPFGLECGDGWYKLVDECCGHLATLARLEGSWPLFVQIKEKYGQLCLYANNITDLQDIVISYYENRSAHVCEECGDYGQIRNSKHWVLTLCSKHAHERGYAISDYTAKEMGLKEGEYVSLDELRKTAKTLQEYT